MVRSDRNLVQRFIERLSIVILVEPIIQQLLGDVTVIHSVQMPQSADFILFASFFQDAYNDKKLLL